MTPTVSKLFNQWDWVNWQMWVPNPLEKVNSLLYTDNLDPQIGKKRAFKLGKVLRRRYDSFLGDIYYPDNILARTTDFDRTKMTALLVLAGLYPPAPTQQWNDDLDWMPIPYHFERGEHDYVSRASLVQFQSTTET